MKTKKTFDCVKMMRDIRTKINADIIDMNPEQIKNYFAERSRKYKSLIADESVLAKDWDKKEENEAWKDL